MDLVNKRDRALKAVSIPRNGRLSYHVHAHYAQNYADLHRRPSFSTVDRGLANAFGSIHLVPWLAKESRGQSPLLGSFQHNSCNTNQSRGIVLELASPGVYIVVTMPEHVPPCCARVSRHPVGQSQTRGSAVTRRSMLADKDGRESIFSISWFNWNTRESDSSLGPTIIGVRYDRCRPPCRPGLATQQ